VPDVNRQDEAAASEAAPAGGSDRVTAVRRRVGLLVALFVLLLVAQLVLSFLLMDSLWALSAYRAGLGEWSRHRQLAVDALLDTFESGEAEARRRLDRELRALAGFETAREALAGEETTDDGQILAGLVRGGLDEQEAAAIVRFESRVSVFPGGDDLMAAWAEADGLIRRLRTLAERAARLRASGGATDLRLDGFRRTISRVDGELEAAEARFAAALVRSQVTLRRRLRLEQIAGSATVILLAIGLGIWTSRRLEKDAAERRRVELALRRNQERLREVVEHSTNLFYSHTTDHRLTYVSPQTRSFFDCEPEEALTRWTDFVTDHPINQRGLALTERAIATGKRQPVYELELQGASGRKVWVEVNEAPIVRDGRTVGIAGALTDVTERKGAEEERARLEERLRLGQKLEAVGRLAGGVAHDFNNLLTAILGYSDLLAQRLGPDHGGAVELAEIRRAGERAASLISQLLAFSRKQVIERRTIDLRRLVEDSARMIRRLIPEDVELELALGGREEEPVLVKADPNQIEQLLINLAVNARDAMPAGGRLSIVASTVRLETARRGDLFDVVPGDYALLEVRDTGAGMDRVTLEHAFEPFYTTKGPGEGTGLGLATVYGIVKQNHGYVWVDSEPGQGTSFGIYLPSAPATEFEPRSEGQESVPAEEKPIEAKVLLVEDESAVRSLVREVLARQGYEVLEASNAREALELSAGRLETIDLLLTDLVMPGLSGADLGRELQQAKPDLAVIYITGYSEGALNARGLLGSDYRLLLKPFKAADLIDRVAEAVELRRAATAAAH